MPELQPAVTIGLPFYNAAGTLADSIRSVFAQSNTEWELMLVDDGSTDASAEIAASVNDSRVRFLSDGRNLGLAHRLNEIARLAAGAYVVRMDADDLMHPKRVDTQLRYVRSSPTTDLVGTAAYTIDGENEPRGVRGVQYPRLTPQSILTRGLFIHPTVMARTDWLRANPYDSLFVRAEDHELWVRASANAHIGWISEPLHFYREPSPLSQRAYVMSCRTDRAILRRYGPAILGRLGTMAPLVVSYAKQAAFICATRLQVQWLVVSRRNKPLDRAQLEEARTVVRSVLSTSVPGLPLPMPDR